MKLIKFIAEDVHGYMDFEVDFNRDVNFLIGTNGSGKTTAIKMIKALLTPSFSELSNINFSTCSLFFERYGKLNKISVYKKKGESIGDFTIIYNDISFAIDMSEIYGKEAFFNEVKNGSREIENIDENIKNPVFDKIRKLPTPIFLGVDRKNSASDTHSSVYKEAFISPSRRHIMKGLLGGALLETQLMIQDSYKGIRGLEEKQSGVLRDSILKSSFKFTSFDPEDFHSKEPRWKQASLLVSKKNEILRALHKIGNVDESLSIEVDNFFSNLERLFDELKSAGDDTGFNLNWLMNQAQIHRISDLVSVIDSYDKKIQEIYRPVSEFINIINKFFEDSNKKIVIDPVGRILIHIMEHRRSFSVDCLSSGERQLLIIIANVIFNKYQNGLSKKRGIIIIDEPELSLHMKWQEMFSEIVLEVSPETQFILATHSPDIVGDLTEKCKKIRKV
ncbi:TPA: AAA family ATPase [Aeromonas salmonicida subsp. pectinolytica]